MICFYRKIGRMGKLNQTVCAGILIAFMFGMSIGTIASYLEPLNPLNFLIINMVFYGLTYISLLEIFENIGKEKK